MEDKITTEKALEYVEKWINEGNKKKAVAGLNEILNFEPDNLKAQKLLKKCQKKFVKSAVISALTITIITCSFVALSHYSETLSKGIGEMFAFFYQDNKAAQNLEASAFNETSLIYDSQKKDSQRNRNEIRTKDIKKISTALEEYYKEHFKYPSAQTAELELLIESYLLEIPVDPLSGSFDKNGEPFDYYYANYEDPITKEANQIYILSANFENNDKEDNVWSISSRTISFYDDYRDLEKKNVTAFKGYILDENNLKKQKSNQIDKDFENNILNLDKLTDEEIKEDDKQRREDLKLIKQALEYYYDDKNSYPDADILESLIHEHISTIPVEKYNLYQNDKGKIYGYYYTVLPNDEGTENQSFVLSALIAKSGKFYLATSENVDSEVKNNTDTLRDLSQNNVTIIGASHEELSEYRSINPEIPQAPRQTKLKR